MLAMGTAVFAAAGPLQPGWARRAGTPVALLGSATAAARSGPSAVLTVTYAGRVRRSAAPRFTITVDARTASPARRLTIVLRGRADGSGIALSSGTVALTGGAGPAERGPVTRLAGHQLTAVLRPARGPGQQAELTLVISGHRASGQLTLQPAMGS
jgi:hypothetical protein